MFRKIVKSAIDKGRLRFVETPKDDQSIPICLDGKKQLHWLLQVDSLNDKKVKTADIGIKLSRKKVVQEHNDNIIVGKNSIKVAMKTPNTRGQQENPKIDASKGQGKHKGKRMKVTFAQLLEKYQKINEEKIAYRPSNSKATRSPPKRKSKDRYW